MWRRKRINELDLREETLLTEIAQRRGELAAVRAERAELYTQNRPETNSLTDQIVEILYAAGTPLSPKEIQQRLEGTETPPAANTVTATIAHLVRSGRVSRIRRGQYVATSTG